MVSRCVKDVQLVNVPPDAVEFPVKILNSRSVLVIESLIEKPRDYGCLSNFGGAQDHHPVAVLGRDVKLILGRCHLLYHICTRFSRWSRVLFF